MLFFTVLSVFMNFYKGIMFAWQDDYVLPGSVSWARASLTPRVYLEWLLVTEDAAGADSFGDKLSAVVPAFLL